jgi:hypothetical protein
MLIVCGLLTAGSSPLGAACRREDLSTPRAASQQAVNVPTGEPELGTGEVLSRHLIDPDKTYWRNQNKEPGRWPGSSK